MKDKMTMTARETVLWTKNPKREFAAPTGKKTKQKDGLVVDEMAMKTATYQEDQTLVAQDYANRTQHTVELWGTSADGGEILILTVEPVAE